eukprot:2303605-Rhodomonas_salina.1
MLALHAVTEGRLCWPKRRSATKSLPLPGARRVVLSDRPHSLREHLKRGYEPRLEGVNDGWA